MFLYCKQRGTYLENAIEERPMKFKNLNEIKNFILEYHTPWIEAERADGHELDWETLPAHQLAEMFDWSIEKTL